MAIAFRAATTASKGDTGSTLVINVPTGTVNDDMILLGVVTRSANTVTTPTGFTLVGSALSDTVSSSARLYVYQRTAASEPASYTVTLSGAQAAAAAMASYSGAASVDASLGTIDTAGDTSLTADAITTTVADTMIVYFGSVNGSASVGDITPPTAMTERGEIESTGTRLLRLEIADVAQAASGTTGAKTATIAAAPGGDEACYLVALAPAAAGAAVLPDRHFPRGVDRGLTRGVA